MNGRMAKKLRRAARELSPGMPATGYVHAMQNRADGKSVPVARLHPDTTRGRAQAIKKGFLKEKRNA